VICATRGHVIFRLCYCFATVQLGNLGVIPKRRIPKAPETFITVEDVQRHVPALTTTLNACLHATYKLLYGEPSPVVFKIAAALYAVSLASKLFGSTGLFFIAFFSIFTLPKVYELKQREIDEVYAKSATVSATLFQQAMRKGDEVMAQLLSYPGTSQTKKKVA